MNLITYEERLLATFDLYWQAAHIVPFVVCRNNDPRNGMALCPLHHWAFDQGMVAVTNRFLVQLHPFANELPADVNFLSLKDRALLLPTDERMHPVAIALAWRRTSWAVLHVLPDPDNQTCAASAVALGDRPQPIMHHN